MPKADVANSRLDSWKDIASYLGRDVRTAIRWEKSKGLPVHRVPGGKRQAVFAYSAELDAWLTRESCAAYGGVPQRLNPIHSSLSGSAETMAFFWVNGNKKLRILYLSTGILAIAVLALATLGIRSSARSGVVDKGSLARVAFTLSSIQAFNDEGRLLWTHRFDGTVKDFEFGGGRHLAEMARVADFRGDGQREVLAIVPLFTDTNVLSVDRWEVDLFSGKGQMLWSYVPRGRFQFGKHELDGPWSTVDDFVSSHAGRKQIWVAAADSTWGNTFVVNLDPVTGKDTLRFVNTGTVWAINEITTPQASFLILGGFNNEANTGSLALMDEAKPFAASPQSEGTRHKCLNCSAGDPDYYFVFPRSEINEVEQVHQDAVIQVEVSGDEIQARKYELYPKNNDPKTIYLLKADQGVRVVSQRFDSGYDMLHRSLEQEGTLRHTIEECPERLHPRPIKEWTPASGWTEVRLEPGRGSE